MLPRRFVPAAALAHTNIRIYAPNGTKIPVMVAVTIQFEVEGVPVNCEFMVSNAIDETIVLRTLCLLLAKRCRQSLAPQTSS